MPQSHFNYEDRKDVLQPPCPDCGMPMWLTGYASTKDQLDIRTFRCVVCERTETVAATPNR